MTELAYTVVDAFADRPFSGNPAAVMPLTEWLPDDLLQAIAMEHNLSETAFTIPCADGEADYELRWFTPETEVMLCGHATLASGHVLIEGERVRFHTRHAGVLEVRRAGDGYELSLPAWKAEPKPLPEVVAALGCAAEETLWHPYRYAVIRVARRDVVRGLRPTSARFGAQGDILTIVTAPGQRDRRGQPRVRDRRGDRRGPGHRLRPCGADPLLDRAAGARHPHSLSGEQARRVCGVPSRRAPRNADGAVRDGDGGGSADLIGGHPYH